MPKRPDDETAAKKRTSPVQAARELLPLLAHEPIESIRETIRCDDVSIDPEIFQYRRKVLAAFDFLTAKERDAGRRD